MKPIRSSVAIAERSTVAAGLQKMLDSGDDNKYLTGRTKKSGEGLQLAKQGQIPLHVSARAKKENFWQAACNRVLGRRTSQHHGAILTLELVVKKFNEDESLKNRGDVKRAIKGIEELLAKKRGSREGIQLGEVRSHLQTFIAADAQAAYSRKFFNEGRQIVIDELYAKYRKPETLAIPAQGQAGEAAERAASQFKSPKMRMAHAAVNRFEGALKLARAEGRTQHLIRDLFDQLNARLDDAYALNQTPTEEKTAPTPRVEAIADPENGKFERFLDVLKTGTMLGVEIGSEARRDDFPELEKRTREFVEARGNLPAGVFPMPGALMKSITVVLNQGLLRPMLPMLDTFIRSIDGKPRLFELTVAEFGGSLSRICEELMFAGRLLTDEAYISSVPEVFRDSLRALGEAIQEATLAFLDERGPFMALHRLVEAAKAAPDETQLYLRAMLSKFQPSAPPAANAQASPPAVMPIAGAAVEAAQVPSLPAAPTTAEPAHTQAQIPLLPAMPAVVEPVGVDRKIQPRPLPPVPTTRSVKAGGQTGRRPLPPLPTRAAAPAGASSPALDPLPPLASPVPGSAPPGQEQEAA
jgi:hypothetical protein